MRRKTRSRVMLRVVGSGDAFGSGGRDHTCFYLETPRSKLLIDCGASALVSMHRLKIDPSTIDAVVLSHLHGDHFGGLPFLLLDAEFVTRRTRPLTIAGPRGTEERLRRTTELLYPGFWKNRARFKIRFIDLEDGRAVSVAGVSVRAFRVVHESGAPAFALRVAHSGGVVGYSGDTAWTERLIEAARGTDLFICEASSYEKPIPFHLTYETVAAYLDRFDAERVVLTHVGPDILARRKTLKLEVIDDGQVFHLRRSRHTKTRRLPRTSDSPGGD